MYVYACVCESIYIYIRVATMKGKIYMCESMHIRVVTMKGRGMRVYGSVCILGLPLGDLNIN